MKNISTGAGLVVLGLGIALHPIVSGLVAQATAAPSSSATSAAAAVASATTAQAGPTVVWMGVTEHSSTTTWNYHRLWSDGRLEVRSVKQTWGLPSGGCSDVLPNPSCTTPWREAPPPPGGNGFACRTDINGDRLVDGADLTFVLNAWGQKGGCEPEATYPCLDLGNLAGGVAAK
jgi:hypothetical protein